MQKITKTRTIKKITLNSYSDPGHGWLKCKRDILVALGIDRDISAFSYERKNDVFLEEDCDAPRLIQALQAKGVEVKFRHTSTWSKQSKIRSYFSYRPR
jgi:hypothetical protein